MRECENSEGIYQHKFVFSVVVQEADNTNIVYHPVGYAVCERCGEIRKSNFNPL